MIIIITIKYGVEITFPDQDIMNPNLLQDIIFNCPELENCAVNVYTVNKKKKKFNWRTLKWN